MQDTRCSKCNKLLGKLTAPYEVKCPRCGEMNAAQSPEQPQSKAG